MTRAWGILAAFAIGAVTAIARDRISETSYVLAGNGTCGYRDSFEDGLGSNAVMVGEVHGLEAIRNQTTNKIQLYFTDKKFHTVRLVQLDGDFELQGYNHGRKVQTIFGVESNNSVADGHASEARFDSPKGILYNDGYLYVCDNSGVRKINLNNSKVDTLVRSWGIEHGVDGFGFEASINPKHIAMDIGEGFLYVTEHRRIRKITLTSNILVETVAGNPFNTSLSAMDGEGTNATFTNLEQIAFHRNPASADKYLLVVDRVSEGSSVLRRVRLDSNYDVTTIIRSNSTGGSPDGNPIHFKKLFGVTIGENGTIFVTDEGGHRIKRITKRSNGQYKVRTIFGFVDGELSVDGVATSTTFKAPKAIAYSGETGSLFWSESGFIRYSSDLPWAPNPPGTNQFITSTPTTTVPSLLPPPTHTPPTTRVPSATRAPSSTGSNSIIPTKNPTSYSLLPTATPSSAAVWPTMLTMSPSMMPSFEPSLNPTQLLTNSDNTLIPTASPFQMITVKIVSLSDSVLSATSTLRLTAQATPVIEAAQGRIRYSWKFRINGDDGEDKGISGVSVNAKIQRFFDGPIIGSSLFEITVIATDSSYPSRFAMDTLNITVRAPPSVTSILVYPLSGVSYNTTFTVNATASGMSPLKFNYRVNQTSLSGTTGARFSQFALPAGLSNFSVEVVDIFGGYDIRYYNESIYVANPSRSPTQDTCRRIDYFYQDFSRFVDVFEIGLDLSNRNDSAANILRKVTRFIYNNRNPIDAVWNYRVFFDILEDIPLEITNIPLQCPEFKFLTGGRNISANMLGIELWEILAEIIDIGISDILTTNGTDAEFIVQSVGDMSNSSNAVGTTNNINSWTGILERAIEQEPAAVFVDTGLGQKVVTAISSVLQRGIENITPVDDNRQPIENCTAIDSVLKLVYRFLYRAGTALPPEGGDFPVMTSQFAGLSKSVYADSKFNGSAPLSRISASLRLPAPDADSTVRDLKILTITALNFNISRCRPTKAKEGIITTPTNIIVNSQDGNERSLIEQVDIVFPKLDTSTRNKVYCGYWSPSLTEWRPDGCDISSETDIDYTCTCTHLTEFVVLERGQENKNFPPEWMYTYATLSALYGVLMFCALYLMVSEVMKYRDIRAKARAKRLRAKFSIAKIIFLFLQSLFRVLLCVILTIELRGQGYSPDNGMVWVIFILVAFPHTLMWGSLNTTVYQWAVVYYSSTVKALIINVFERYIYILALMFISVVLAVWSSFAIFFFLPEFAIIGPIVLASISLIFGIAIPLGGKLTSDLLRKVKGESGSTGVNSRREECFLAIFVITLASCLLLQSIAWVISLGLSLKEDQFFSAMIVYYTCDILIITIQLDFLHEMKGTLWIASILWLKTLTISSERSSKSGSSKLASTRPSRKTPKWASHANARTQNEGDSKSHRKNSWSRKPNETRVPRDVRRKSSEAKVELWRRQRRSLISNPENAKPWIPKRDIQERTEPVTPTGGPWASKRAFLKADEKIIDEEQVKLASRPTDLDDLPKLERRETSEVHLRAKLPDAIQEISRASVARDRVITARGENLANRGFPV
ncbi:hypothetical protein AAMO2058_000432400 [Amorphochlora amoebiformis]